MEISGWGGRTLHSIVVEDVSEGMTIEMNLKKSTINNQIQGY